MHRPLPEKANHAGNLHGGNLMRYLDEVGSLVAIRYARGRIVTASVNGISFLGPVLPNEIVHFHGAVNAVWKSSMEVGIRTESENPYTGALRHVGSCYLTFVSLDEHGAPRLLPPLVPENKEDERRMADAARRSAFSRLDRRSKGSSLPSEGLAFESMPGKFAVCKLPSDAPFPDFSFLPQSSCFGLFRVLSYFSCVLAEEFLAVFQKNNPTLEVCAGFVCFTVAGMPTLSDTPFLAGVAMLLTSAQISAYSVFLQGNCCLLLKAEDLEQAVDVLKNAGYAF
jgi:acyl-CoA hydrolase